MRTKLFFHSLLLFSFAFGLVVTSTIGASAQAKITADRDAEFDAFGGYTYIGRA